MNVPVRVFLADDHTIVREGLRLLLEAQGDLTVVGEAADGLETVRLVKQMCPDVVVMDIAMPGLDGIRATKEIHEFCPATQVVILSIYSSSEHIFQALRAGARGYLLKESAGKEVAEAVRSVHARRRYLCRQITETVIDDYIRKYETLPVKSPLESLSSREREILQLIVNGKTNTEIAKILSLSIKTVETYKSRLMQKLNIRDLASLVKFAIQHGLTSAE
jgi:DNA-binding NarL/FixJ family response regulator